MADPTPEQIAAMEARGWALDTVSYSVPCFRISVDPFNLSVWYDINNASGWHWSSPMSHPTQVGAPNPQSAALRAEDWLRSVLAPLAARLTWLEVES